jgi:ectoine hydroxylase-related dioxygenase (phytanoyl-CoA dioxygenase family)
MTDIAKDGYGIFRATYAPEFMRLLEQRLPIDPELCINFCKSATVRVIARRLLGEELLGTGEEQVNVNPATVYDQWHYDYPFDTDRPVPLYRFALYFRDYTDFAGGIMFVPGSHLGKTSDPKNLDVERAVAAKTRPGDLVVWNLRTFHAADAPNEDRPRATPRNAVFWDYAAPSPERDKYIQWRIDQKKLRAELKQLTAEREAKATDG